MVEKEFFEKRPHENIKKAEAINQIVNAIQTVTVALQSKTEGDNVDIAKLNIVENALIREGPYENIEKTEIKGVATNVLSLDIERKKWALAEKSESAIQAEYVAADIDEEDIKRNEQYILSDDGNGNVTQQRCVMIQV